MRPYYADEWLTVYQGDCRDVLPTLAADSVDCVVTSPPYWGLRDYGTATWAGGDTECDHMEEVKPGSLNEGFNERWGNAAGDRKQETRALRPFKDACRRCGATRQDAQLGLEATPEEYVANLVAVFREVRRVLKPSGTCWLNLGDSYNNVRGNVAPEPMNRQQPAVGGMRSRGWVSNLKPKDLVGIPWRVAFALQADGWYLRSDIIWSKPNPMPESVTDRPTKAHEYLFLLTKSARYFFDADAVREAQVKGSAGSTFTDGKTGINGMGRVSPAPREDNPAGRNLRSVWTIATRPYADAHFAVFPPELPERCIKAGSSERGVCPECGAPWERVVETVDHGRGVSGYSPSDNRDPRGTQRSGPGSGALSVVRKTTGWTDPCGNDLNPEPAVVLDPFAGSGTVGLVANRLSRRAILIDLNPDYLRQQMQRNAQTPLGLAGR